SRRVTTRPESSARSTQPAIRIEEPRTQTLELTNFKIPEGEWPEVRVFDEKTGELKYFFKAAEWKPIGGGGTEFAVTQPNAEILLPGGQKAYVRADQGNIVVQRGDGNNVDPRRGWFKGNVYILVDRTTPEWRKENPHLADPETHPETVVRFWLEEVRFDMDLAQLISDGDVRMERDRKSVV